MFDAQYDMGLTIKQIKLVYPMVDYTCLIWMSAARAHVRTLQVLQSKYFHFSIRSPWNIGKRKIREDLGVPYFSDHMKSLTERLKISSSGNPIVRQIDRYLRLPIFVSGLPKSPKRDRNRQTCRGCVSKG